jgi:quercetin dioxygenase-like cupin family protein
MAMSSVFDSLTELLPYADVHPAVRAFLSQGDDHQVVFMEFTEDLQVPEHSHAAQLEIVVAGEVELITAEGKKTYRPGDWFYLDAEVKHGAVIKEGYKSIGVFFQKDRYKAK